MDGNEIKGVTFNPFTCQFLTFSEGFRILGTSNVLRV